MKNHAVSGSVILLSFLLGLGGCATVQFAPSKENQAYSARTPADSIELFRSSSPTKKYFEIGAVSACCDSDTNRIIKLLKSKASETGGDALIGLDVNARGRASATVIRYE